MTHELQEIQWEGTSRDPVYLRFSNEPVARTEERAGGEVVVDFDGSNGVVGIEMLCTDPDIWETVGQVGRQYSLGFTLFLSAAKVAE